MGKKKRKKPVFLTQKQANEIRKKLAQSIPVRNLVVLYNVSKQTVKRIGKGTWRGCSLRSNSKAPKPKSTDSVFERDLEFEKRSTEYMKAMMKDCERQLAEAKTSGSCMAMIGRALVMLSETTFPKVMVLKAFLEVGNE